MQENEGSQTAVRVALTRALENRFPEHRRICSDPKAHLFLDDRARRIYASFLRRRLFYIKCETAMPGVVGAVLARTRHIDNCLDDAVDAGIDQLVILGAGYDTRSLRLRQKLSGVKVFEVDHPATQERKRSILKSAEETLPKNLSLVPARFDSDDLGRRLLEAGFDPRAKTFFTWEGVTYYLTQGSATDTLAFISGSAGAGSRLVFDYFPPSVADGTCRLKEARFMRSLFAGFGEGLTFGIEPGRIEQFLGARGFGAVRSIGHGPLRSRYVTPKRRALKVSQIFWIAEATVTG